MQKVNVYIDGFNLYHAIAAMEKPELKWIKLHLLGRSFLRRKEYLNRVIFLLRSLPGIGLSSSVTRISSSRKRHAALKSLSLISGEFQGIVA